MAIETNELIDVQTLSPFKKFIMTIGNIPTSYLESMSYAELLMWFCNYLQNTVIPTVNNNAQAVEELQGLYITLHDYVENYFDNLDVQEEINNKLDAMAENGTLTNLIKNYVDPIQEAFEDEINDELTQYKSLVNSQISTLNTKIDQATSGSPLVASSTAGMTDTTRVYVNTTDGNWYYYDGDSWEIGGVYQSSGVSASDPVIASIISDSVKTDYYTQRNSVINGINIYRQEFVESGYWIGGDGVVHTDANSKTAVIPVCSGNHVILNLGKYFTSYTSNALGGIQLLDENKEVLDTLDYANVKVETTEGLYNNYTNASFELTSGTAYLRFTVKLVTLWDCTDTITLVYGQPSDFVVDETYNIDILSKRKEIYSIYNEELDNPDTKPYIGIKWAVFGDSLTEVNSTAETKYYNYISDNLGFSIVNYGHSGSGYRSAYDDSNSFYQRMANIDPDDFDVLTIFGSGNDIKYLKNGTMPLGTANDYCAINQEPTTIAACINRTLEQYYAIAPTKPIGLITPTPWYAYCTGWRMNRDDAVYMQQYADLIIEIGKIRGIPVLDLFNCSNLRPWDGTVRSVYYNENGVQDNGTHPNSLGHKLISAPIQEFIKSIIPE